MPIKPSVTVLLTVLLAVAPIAPATARDISASARVDQPIGSFRAEPTQQSTADAVQEYRIAAGTVEFAYEWSATCPDDQGACGETPDNSTTASVEASSNAVLQVRPGEWVREDRDDRLEGAADFEAFAYHHKRVTDVRRGDDCLIQTQETEGAVTLLGAPWVTGLWIEPAGSTGLEVTFDEQHNRDWDGGWSEFQFVGPAVQRGGLAAGYPQITERRTNDFCTGSATNASPINLYWLEYAITNDGPQRVRRIGLDVATDVLEPCDETTCRWQINGTATYEYVSDLEPFGMDGSGSASTRWSYVIERRTSGSTELVTDFTHEWRADSAMDLDMTFAASTSGEAPASHTWDFGDGTTGTGATPTHSYPAPGRYQVTLTTSAGTETATRSRWVVVNPVATFAPELEFTKGEDFWPMDQATFIEESTLRWAHDNCRDSKLAEHGEIDASELSSGGYTAREKRPPIGGCTDKGKTYRSDQVTRPYAKPRIKQNPDEDEGFFLDLKNSARDGTKPKDGRAVRLYVSYEPEEYVTYWFMYGYDNKGGGPLGVVDLGFGHEGEWERVIVHLNADDDAAGASYFQHNCPGEYHPMVEVTGSSAPDGNTHPKVYVARGAHASYAAPKTIKKGSCRAESKGIEKHQGRGDVATGGSRVWQTWHDLAFIEDQPWYGYGGAWGEVQADSNLLQSIATDWSLNYDFLNSVATGPLGPPHLDPSG